MEFNKKEIEKRILKNSPNRWKHLGFAILPSRILTDNSISRSSLILFWVLTIHIFRGKSYCFPSLDTIAREAHCSRPTAIKAIRGLEKLGYLEVDRSRGGQSNKYYLKIDI
jgi:biotin operon repressor